MPLEGGLAEIGVWMSPEVLEESSRTRRRKTPRRRGRRRARHEASIGETNRLFVASVGFWRGCFLLADEVLYNPADEQAPFSFVFDADGTWTAISPVVP
jgi:hypothetical protein